MRDETLIYASSNGDVWSLVEDAESMPVLVRHQPNRASGGVPSFIPVTQFLSEGRGPQHEALLWLLNDVNTRP